MRITFKHIIVAIAALLAGAILAGRAAAMSPSQTNAYWLANTIQFNQQTGATPYGSIEHFWSLTLGTRYVRPGVFWYGDYYGNRDTGCRGDYGVPINTASWRNNAFYCSGDGTVYLDYEYLNSLIAQYGDFAAGGIIAHEWGHRIQDVLGYTDTSFRREYHADCLAGMYTRWAYGKLLTGGDYWEFNSWLKDRTPSASHGTPYWRTAFFYHGYNQYSIAACNVAWTMNFSSAARTNGTTSLKPPAKRKVNLRLRRTGLPSLAGTPAKPSGSSAGIAASGVSTIGFDSTLSLVF
jgi:predicted metalloprotease